MKMERKKTMHRYWKRISGIGAALAVALVSVGTPFFVKAEDAVTLEEKTQELQSQLDGMNQELLAISDEISSAEMQIQVMNSEIVRSEELLREAQENEAQQYQDMKIRIKYLYENGSNSYLTALAEQESLADVLNKAEFIQSISEYDRDMLIQLKSIREDVELNQQILEEQQDDLAGLQEELAARQAELEEKAAATSTDLTAYNEQLQHLRELQSGMVGEIGLSDGRTVQVDSISVSADDEELLAALIECEAYQDYNYLLAVATVVMNRVEDPRFPNTISEVIYASNQFYPASNGTRLSSVLEKGPTDLSRRVAHDALNGTRLAEVADCYYFLMASACDKDGVNIGGNVFFQVW